MRDISLSRYCKILVQNIGAHNVVSLFELRYQLNPRVLLSVTIWVGASSLNLVRSPQMAFALGERTDVACSANSSII